MRESADAAVACPVLKGLPMSLSGLRTVSVFAILGGVFLIACGAGNGGDGFGLGDDGGISSSSGSNSSSGSGQRDSGYGSSSGSSSSGSSSGVEEDSGSSSGSTSSSGGGGTCGACTTDSECESSCPPVQGGGTNCCDVGSGVCYATTQNTCPTPSDGGVE